MVIVSPRTDANAPSGIRLYAMGDIHGRLDLLDTLLDMIEKDDAGRPAARTILIFLGDYVDRGPNSKGVVDRLAGGLPDRFETHTLKGNHEDLLLSFLSAPEMLGLNWLQNGGDATLASYGLEDRVIEDAFRRGDQGLRSASTAFARLLPERHLKFYRNLSLSYRAGDYFFVHGGVRPGIPLDRQIEDDMLWIRGEFLRWPGSFGAVVVHGHTPVKVPADLMNRVGIDTYAVRTGRLTAAGFEGSSRWFLTT